MSNKFKYYLRPDAFSYYVANGGLASTTSVKTPLQFDLIEWNSIELKWLRNSRYHGVTRSFVLPATFAKDGATILRHVYFTQGYNGACIFEVEMLNDDGVTYDLLYSGAVDFFGGYVDNDTSVQIAIVDGGLPALLSSKEDTTFEVPIYDTECKQVFMDGVKLKNKAYYVVTADMWSTVTLERQMSPTMSLTTSEAPYIDDLKSSRTEQHGSSSFLAANNFIYTATYAGVVTVGFSGAIRMQRPPGDATSGAMVVAIFRNGATQTLHNIFVGPTFPSTTGVTFETIPYTTINITVAIGETLTLLFGSDPIVNSTPTSNRWAFNVISPGGGLPAIANFDIAFNMRLPATTVRMYRAIQVWQKVMSSMSAGLYGIVSSFLNNPTVRNFGNNPYNTLLTSGDAARGLGSGSVALLGITTVAKPAVIKTSLRDLFADATCRDMLGLGVEGTNIRVEPLAYFYDNTTVSFELGLVSNFKKSVNQEPIFNLLKIGYPYNSNDALNGKQDPHTTFTYGTAAKTLNKELSLVSPYVASMYAWEYKRANLGGKTTTDDSGDNDILIAEISGAVDGSGRSLLYRPQNDSGNSIAGQEAADTAFNLTLMPEYNLRRNGPLLHTGTHLMDSTDLSFQSAQQNDAVVSKLGALLDTITAKANIPVSSLGTPLYLPIKFEFDTAVPTGFKTAIEANQYGRVKFTVKHPITGLDIDLAGFIDEVNIKPGNNGVCSWALHACPDTNLSNLIF